MSLGFVLLIVLLVVLIGGGYGGYANSWPGPYAYGYGGVSLLLVVLLVVLLVTGRF